MESFTDLVTRLRKDYLSACSATRPVLDKATEFFKGYWRIDCKPSSPNTATSHCDRATREMPLPRCNVSDGSAPLDWRGAGREKPNAVFRSLCNV
eukprot:2356735-Pyramimonas_sp.AAC.1